MCRKGSNIVVRDVNESHTETNGSLELVSNVDSRICMWNIRFAKGNGPSTTFKGSRPIMNIHQSLDVLCKISLSGKRGRKGLQRRRQNYMGIGVESTPRDGAGDWGIHWSHPADTITETWRGRRKQREIQEHWFLRWLFINLASAKEIRFVSL